MKKMTFLSFAFLFHVCVMFSQPVTEWERKIDPTRINKLVDFITLKDGSYISVGLTYIDDISRSFEYDYFKFDCNGRLVWQKKLANYITGNSFGNGSIKIATIKDNIFAISGTYSQTDSVGSLAGFVTLIDSVGNVLKSKEFIGSNVNIRSIISDGGENLIVALGTRSNNGLFQGNKGNNDIWVLKLDLKLNILQKKNIGGEGNDECFSIIKSKDGGYIITGSTGSKTGDFKAPYSNPNAISGQGDAFVLKLDESLEVLWSTAFGGNQTDIASTALEMPDRTLVIGGTTSSYDGVFYGRPTSYSYDAYVARLGPSGSFISAKPIGNDRTKETSTFNFSQLLPLDTSNYLLLCYGKTREGLFNVGNEMTWLLKMNTKSEIVWKKGFGTERYVSPGYGNRGYQIKKTMDNGYLIVGEVDDSVTYRKNLWLLKLSPLEVDKQVTCEGLTLYPNPTTGNIKIQSVEYLQTGTEIKIYDVIGRNIYQGVTDKACKDSDITLPNSLSSGIYYLSISKTKCVLPFVRVN